MGKFRESFRAEELTESLDASFARVVGSAWLLSVCLWGCCCSLPGGIDSRLVSIAFRVATCKFVGELLSSTVLLSSLSVETFSMSTNSGVSFGVCRKFLKASGLMLGNGNPCENFASKSAGNPTIGDGMEGDVTAFVFCSSLKRLYACSGSLLSCFLLCEYN